MKKLLSIAMLSLFVSCSSTTTKQAEVPKVDKLSTSIGCNQGLKLFQVIAPPDFCEGAADFINSKKDRFGNGLVDGCVLGIQSAITFIQGDAEKANVILSDPNNQQRLSQILTQCVNNGKFIMKLEDEFQKSDKQDNII